MLALFVKIRRCLLGQVAEEVGRVVDEPIQWNGELVEGFSPQVFFDTGNHFHGEAIHGVPEPLSRSAGNGNGEQAREHGLFEPGCDSVLTPGLTDPVDGREHQILTHIEIRRGECRV